MGPSLPSGGATFFYHLLFIRRRSAAAVCWAFVFLPTLLSAQQAPLDLKSALALADSNNLELRAARQQRALALAGLSTAGQRPNPSLSFAAGRDVPHESLQLDLPVELGGKRSKRLEVSRQEQKATEIDIEVLSRQVRRRTREAFFQVLQARELSAENKDAVRIATRVHELAQQRFEAGDVAQIEVVQADVEQTRAEADYEVAAEAQRSAEVNLSALLNQPARAPIILFGKLDELPPPPELERATAQAMKSNAGLLKTAQELATEERRLELARSERIPDLTLQAAADFNSPPDFQAGGKGGFAITLPLLYHGQGEVALSTAKIEFLRLSLAAQQNLADAQVASAYYDYAAKSHQAELYRDRIVPRSVKLEQMAEESYRSGKTTVLTLLDAQRRLNDVRKSYLDALLAAQISFAALEEAVGATLD